MPDLFAPRLADMIACAEREVAMRERAYPRFVSSGRMSQDKADREIATMRAIAGRLRTLAAEAGEP